MNASKLEDTLINGLLMVCIVKTAVISGSSWTSVGILCALAFIWAPHAYFQKKKNENYHSTSYNKKKIESLTSSLNMLSLKLKEVEKLTHQVSKAQGFTNLNRKYTL